MDIAWILVNTSISTSKSKFGWFPSLPLCPHLRGNFLNIHLRKKKLFSIKYIGFHFRIGSIIVFLLFLSALNTQFTFFVGGFQNYPKQLIFTPNNHNYY